jgi:hypothetical protein
MNQSKVVSIDNPEFKKAVMEVVKTARIQPHEHDDITTDRVDFKNLKGIIPTVDAEPTYIPRRSGEQIVLYVNGTTYRLYIYDIVNKAWHYSTLT